MENAMEFLDTTSFDEEIIEKVDREYEHPTATILSGNSLYLSAKAGKFLNSDYVRIGRTTHHLLIHESHLPSDFKLSRFNRGRGRSLSCASMLSSGIVTREQLTMKTPLRIKDGLAIPLD